MALTNDGAREVRHVRRGGGRRQEHPDPDARGLLMWETVCPQPNEALVPGETDPRYTMIKEYFEANRDAEFQKIHFVSADTPEECCVLHVYSFDGVQTGWEILLEPYCSWFKQHDLSFLYEEHHRHLKLLQWQRPGKRWLLKAPAHMWALPELLPQTLSKRARRR